MKQAIVGLQPIPVGTILTMAGTGSEMNPRSVLSSLETKHKQSIYYEGVRPKITLSNPRYTLTVSRNHMFAGIVDITSHIIDQYLTDEEAFLQSRLMEAIFKTVVHSAQILAKDSNDLTARSNIA